MVTLLDELTAQETRVLEASLCTDRVKAIADQMDLSANTIRSHRQRSLSKWRRICPSAKGGKAGMLALLRMIKSYLIPKSS